MPTRGRVLRTGGSSVAARASRPVPAGAAWRASWGDCWRGLAVERGRRRQTRRWIGRTDGWWIPRVAAGVNVGSRNPNLGRRGGILASKIGNIINQ